MGDTVYLGAISILFRKKGFSHLVANLMVTVATCNILFHRGSLTLAFEPASKDTLTFWNMLHVPPITCSSSCCHFPFGVGVRRGSSHCIHCHNLKIGLCPQSCVILFSFLWIHYNYHCSSKWTARALMSAVILVHSQVLQFSTGSPYDGMGKKLQGLSSEAWQLHH